MTKFEVGDTVYRHQNVFNQTSPLHEGIVLRVYGSINHPELYSVFWWDRLVLERGFLPHGLMPPPKNKQT